MRFQQTWSNFTQDDYYEMLADVRTAVSCWTENTMEEGKVPSLDGFMEHYPEWDHSELFEVIESEIARVREIVEGEQIETLMYGGGDDENNEISAYPCW